MQAQAPTKTGLCFQVVTSVRFPGNYACEAIDDNEEGIEIVVEFVAHDSRRLAEEYAAWMNSRS